MRTVFFNCPACRGSHRTEVFNHRFLCGETTVFFSADWGVVSLDPAVLPPRTTADWTTWAALALMAGLLISVMYLASLLTS